VLKNCVEKFTQVLSCVVCTLLRRHVHKQITKRRYREEKPGHFVFGKPVLFTLGLGLTRPIERNVRLCVNCLIYFLGEYSSILREICRILAQIQSICLRGISGKNYFRTIFLKFCEKPRLSSSKICEISPYLLQFFSVLKNSHKYFHVFFSPC